MKSDHSPATTFADLGLAEPLLRALRHRAYTKPTPIQAQTIPQLLAGRDLLGIAQTGTGKTAAFALPVLQLLNYHTPAVPGRSPRALILTPTRELAAQILDSFDAYGQHLQVRHTVVYGGVGQAPQVQALRRGVEILVATPGRLLDLMDQGHASLNRVEIFVLDEADRMLDMGFLRDVRKIIAKLPAKRQSMLFSATMPEEIVSLAASILHRPLRVEVTPQASTVERIRQMLYRVEKGDKRDLLAKILLDPELERTLVFTRTRHGADRVVKHLKRDDIPAQAIHGDKSQTARERALDSFRDGRCRVLIATDIAARGIDVPGITHVVNFDLPNVPESYVHRIGRTARAGRDGTAISFCSSEERDLLRAIEKLIRQTIPVEPLPDLGPRELEEPHHAPKHGPTKHGPAKSREEPRPRSLPRPAQAPAHAPKSGRSGPPTPPRTAPAHRPPTAEAGGGRRRRRRNPRRR